MYSLDDGFVRVVVRSYGPVRVVRRLEVFRRHRIGRDPQLRRPIVDGVSHAVNPAAGISSPAMGADDSQVERAVPFDIPV